MQTIHSGYISFLNIYSLKKHVSYTYNSVELIQIGTEQLRNKRIFISFPFCIFILSLGAFFKTDFTIQYIYPPFHLTFAVIYIKIDSVNNFAITITAIITERDFKGEYWFRMCSIVTNLMTSLEFKSVRCATTPCQFGWARNGYIATQFFLLSSTAESSATRG